MDNPNLFEILQEDIEFVCIRPMLQIRVSTLTQIHKLAQGMGCESRYAITSYIQRVINKHLDEVLNDSPKGQKPDADRPRVSSVADDSSAGKPRRPRRTKSDPALPKPQPKPRGRKRKIPI